jgi:hypothetical protein
VTFKVVNGYYRNVKFFSKRLCLAKTNINAHLLARSHCHSYSFKPRITLLYTGFFHDTFNDLRQVFLMEFLSDTRLYSIKLVPLFPLSHLMIRLDFAPTINEAGSALIERGFNAKNVLISRTVRVSEDFTRGVLHHIIMTVICWGLSSVDVGGETFRLQLRDVDFLY